MHSDYEAVACYLELYEEGDGMRINDPTQLPQSIVSANQRPSED